MVLRALVLCLGPSYGAKNPIVLRAPCMVIRTLVLCKGSLCGAKSPSVVSRALVWH